jgi:hypothetical protein
LTSLSIDVTSIEYNIRVIDSGRKRVIDSGRKGTG